MSLNINNPETYTLIRELTILTGESPTTAVRERLERPQRQERGNLSERLLAIGRAAAPLFEEPFDSSQIVDLLYDEYGLPK